MRKLLRRDSSKGLAESPFFALFVFLGVFLFCEFLLLYPQQQAPIAINEIPAFRSSALEKGLQPLVSKNFPYGAESAAGTKLFWLLTKYTTKELDYCYQWVHGGELPGGTIPDADIAQQFYVVPWRDKNLRKHSAAVVKEIYPYGLPNIKFGLRSAHRACYDPVNATMWITAPANDVDLNVILVHEAAHALQTGRSNMEILNRRLKKVINPAAAGLSEELGPSLLGNIGATALCRKTDPGAYFTQAYKVGNKNYAYSGYIPKAGYLLEQARRYGVLVKPDKNGKIKNPPVSIDRLLADNPQFLRTLIRK